jgi:hypothetical protein
MAENRVEYLLQKNIHAVGPQFSFQRVVENDWMVTQVTLMVVSL